MVDGIYPVIHVPPSSQKYYCMSKSLQQAKKKTLNLVQNTFFSFVYVVLTILLFIFLARDIICYSIRAEWKMAHTQ